MTEYAGRQLVPGDRLLRRDIRLLGWQFRGIVRQHCGKGIWQELYYLRQLAQQRRQGDQNAEQEIASALKEIPLPRLALLTRAMEVFFDLSNLAEDRHRVRVLRQREALGRQSETIRGAVTRLRTVLGTSKLMELLRRLQIEPVFTAHPTEAKRRTVRRILRRLRRDLYLIDRPNQLRSERRRRLHSMRSDLLALWSTDPLSPRKPTVMEELRRTIYAVRTLWQVGPGIMQRLRIVLEESQIHDTLKQPLQFGNWIGGDRDGNPHVTGEVTRSTLELLRSTAIALHRGECRSLRRRLTSSSVRCPLPRSLKNDIEQARLRWPSLAEQLRPLHPNEWIVQWLTIIDQRLRHSKNLPDAEVHPMAYRSADELASDVSRISSALQAAGYDELQRGTLLHWQDRIRIFGLHLLRLDIRIDSATPQQAIAEILAASGQRNDYLALDEGGRCLALAQSPTEEVAAFEAEDLGTEAADLLDVLTLAQRLAHSGHSRALGQFIVSMTHQPSDVLALNCLMQVAAYRSGCSKPAGYSLVPLFETIDDLAKSDRVLEAILSDQAFREQVERCGSRLTCMIGYSDSAKDGGYLASNWALYDAQRRLSACARRNGVTLTIFHGRGGAIGRGGGPAARAITSLPREAVDGRLRLTEQGEVIAERYDDPAITSRHLEQLFWATLCQSVPDDERTPQDAESLAQELVLIAYKAYRQLVESPYFENYMRHCTALPLIEKLPIGSRPSRRADSTRLENLRAIPFTFAWNQVRMPINAFYGLGTAFDSVSSEELQRASELYQQWPWFRAIIDNAELALARCDPAIARRYALLAPDQAEALRLWERLREEYYASRRAVFQIKKGRTITKEVPWLDRTIRVRNPYLDMLNLVQLELMTRLDSGESSEESEAILAALRLSVQAIAAGLRNTG